MFEAWNCLRSAASRKEHVIGAPIILCGFIAIESASSLPFSLILCLDEKIAGPPHEASVEPNVVFLANLGERLNGIIGAEDGGACSGVEVERGISLLYSFVD